MRRIFADCTHSFTWDAQNRPTGAFTKYVHPDVVREGPPATAVTTWLHRDHLNSVRLTTDSAGLLKEQSN